MGKLTKVCILQNGMSYGGTDTFVLNLCRGIDKSHFDVTVMIPPTENSPYNPLLDKLKATGVTIVHTSPLGGWRSLLKHLIMEYKILRKERFDVFHTNVDLFNGILLIPAWLAKVPLKISHSHNGSQARAVENGRNLPVRLYQSLMRWLCRHLADRYTGCSPVAMQFLYSGFRWETNEYPQIINNGIDISKFRQAIDIPALKRVLGLTKSRNLLVVGHINIQKNPLMTVEVFHEVCKQNDDIGLIWLGKGEMKSQVDKKLAEYGITDRVWFLGQRSDVVEIMKCADLLLMPSFFEGLPLSLIEAQVAGLACLVSDTVSPMADLGLCKFLSIKDGTYPWVKAISQILDKKIEMRINDEAVSKFSIDNMVSQMQKVFTK